MKFELTEKEEKRCRKFQDKIKEKYGQYGEFRFIFTPTGIGCAIEIHSILADKTKNITDYKNW